MKEPVDHIIRPQLPWRKNGEGAVTECGYDATKVKSITRGDFFKRIKNIGKQRTAMVTCMTCADTASRWGTWEDDPRPALDREIVWEMTRNYRNDRGQRLKNELLAIADLIEKHKEEFDAFIDQHIKQQEWNEMKARKKEKKSEGGSWDGPLTWRPL